MLQSTTTSKTSKKLHTSKFDRKLNEFPPTAIVARNQLLNTMLTLAVLLVGLAASAQASSKPVSSNKPTTVYTPPAPPVQSSIPGTVLPDLGPLIARQSLQEHNSCLYDPTKIHYCAGLHFRDPCWVTTPTSGVCNQFKDNVTSFRSPSTHGCAVFTDDACGANGGDQWTIFPSEAHGDLTHRRFPYYSFSCAENIINWKRGAAPLGRLAESSAEMVTTENTLADEGLADFPEMRDGHVDRAIEVRSEAFAMDLRNVFFCESFDFQPPCYGLPPAENVCKQWTKRINSFRSPSMNDCYLYTSKSCDEGNGPNSVYKVVKGDAVGVLKLAAGYPHLSYVCKNNI